MLRDIGFLAFPGFQLVDLSGSLAVFEVAGNVAPATPYRLRLFSVSGGLITSSAGAAVATEAVTKDALDTLVVPGGQPCVAEAPPDLIATVRELAPRCRRVASICTGAFVLAHAGLLDGRRATTHWRHVHSLRRRFPRIRVDPEPFFVRDDPVWTATGTNAGIDMALAMITEDSGYAVSRATAQLMVVHPRRPGGQSQFAAYLDVEPVTPGVRRALDYARTHLQERLSIEDLAEVACLSPRQLSRLFTAELGVPPAKVVERLRAETARLQLETSRDPIELIAHKAGFMDPERMRRTFLRIFGQAPRVVRAESRSSPGQPQNRGTA